MECDPFSWSRAFPASTMRRAHNRSGAWQWNMSGNIFAGVNYQHRKAADLNEVESQNWVMATGERPAGPRPARRAHDVLLRAVHAEGYRLAAGISDRRDLQRRPAHRLSAPARSVFDAERRLRASGRVVELTTMAAAVGAPALGPPPFMHRPSAAENPQSPLGHHHLDSVHITPGVLTLGVSRSGMAIETSWFRGREPDEKRTDIDLGALDSWSLRGSWTKGRGALSCPARTSTNRSR